MSDSEKGGETRPPWNDSMFDGATFIGPLNHFFGNDEPVEFDGIGGPNYFHDKNYYERNPKGREWVDAKWLELMLLAAEGLRGSNPERADHLIKVAHERYCVVRTWGWIWWET